jgi:hypothetical protein
MADRLSFPGNYQIEVSGWGLDDVFFVEKTDLLWSQTGDKQVLLHRALPEGTVIFVRLLASKSTDGSLPVAYRVEGVRPMDCDGQCAMKLLQVQPRSKEPIAAVGASYRSEETFSTREQKKCSTQPEFEEILQ